MNSIILQADLPRPTTLPGIHTTNYAVCCKTTPATICRGEIGTEGEKISSLSAQIVGERTYIDGRNKVKTDKTRMRMGDRVEILSNTKLSKKRRDKQNEGQNNDREAVEKASVRVRSK